MGFADVSFSAADNDGYPGQAHGIATWLLSQIMT